MKAKPVVPSTQSQDAALEKRLSQTIERNSFSNTGGILLAVSAEVLQAIDEATLELIRYFSPRPHTKDEVRQAYDIGRSKGVAAANEYLKNCQRRRNFVSGERTPTRRSVAYYLLRLGVERYKKEKQILFPE